MNILKSKNIILYEILVAIFIFTIIYFIVANHISYSFSYDEKLALYESKINLITSCAEIYAQKNMDLFNEKDTVYITVNDLVESGLIDADDESGNVKDPSSDVKTLNDIKIRISYKNDKISSKILTN